MTHAHENLLRRIYALDLDSDPHWRESPELYPLADECADYLTALRLDSYDLEESLFAWATLCNVTAQTKQDAARLVLRCAARILRGGV